MGITATGTLALGTVEAPNPLLGLSATMARAQRVPKILWSGRFAREIKGFSETPDAVRLADYVKANVEPVTRELDVLEAARRFDPVEYARRVVIFSMLSPAVEFNEAMYAAWLVRRHLFDIETIEDVYSLMVYPTKDGERLGKLNYWTQKAERIYTNVGFLRGITPADMTATRLRSVNGIGPKVLAFSLALWDRWAPVFTLDLWMARITLKLARRCPLVKASIPYAGYAVTEAEWLQWRAEHLPEISPFAAQWALWNGAFGHHVSHLALVA